MHFRRILQDSYRFWRIFRRILMHFWRILKETEIFCRILTDFEGFLGEFSCIFEGFWRILLDSYRFWRILMHFWRIWKDFRRFWRILGNFEGFWRILQDSYRFGRIFVAIWMHFCRFWRILGNFEGFWRIFVAIWMHFWRIFDNFSQFLMNKWNGFIWIYNEIVIMWISRVDICRQEIDADFGFCHFRNVAWQRWLVWPVVEDLAEWLTASVAITLERVSPWLKWPKKRRGIGNEVKVDALDNGPRWGERELTRQDSQSVQSFSRPFFFFFSKNWN